ncbi:hypothetical protein PC117_g11603 [Phytophthora cactorum]|uniref:Integrase catalytic domain-containing protein n=1 Tax=Phytophthora cactorum TaxID=29920 RepID=A0A8T1DCS7_9STRA|nr:hypothetical protein PC117_g11603 [Phytophthora cactorum]
MSGFFRAFNRIVGQKQRATMAYRPQANGTAERMKAWDEYVERLMIALNTAHDRPRGDTPFYLAHGWDARSTLEPSLPLGSTWRGDCEPRRWRYSIKRHQEAVPTGAGACQRGATCCD